MLGFEEDEPFHSMKKTKRVIRTDTREAARLWLPSATVGFWRLIRWFPVRLATSDATTHMCCGVTTGMKQWQQFSYFGHVKHALCNIILYHCH